MAKHVETRLVDDMDGSDGAESIEFSFEGRDLVIDLSEEHASQLREVLAPYVGAARRAGGSVKRQTSTPAGTRRDLSEVRAWLQQAGYEVKDRGRISEDLMTAYESRTPAAGEPLPASDAEVPEPTWDDAPVRAVPDAIFSDAAAS